MIFTSAVQRLEFYELSKQTVPREYVVHMLEKYKDDDNAYVSFVNLPKFGINPKSVYDTPIGLYCYPIKFAWEYYNSDTGFDLIHRLPFQSKAPYAVIFKVKPEHLNTIIKSDSYTEEDLIKHYDLLHAELLNNYNIDLSSIVSFYDLSHDTAHNKYGNAKYLRKLWHVLYFVSRNKIGAKTAKVSWNKLFRMIAINGVSDSGNSIIHDNEPCQAVFFTKSVLKVIGLYRNRTTRPDVTKSIEIKKYQSLCAKHIKEAISKSFKRDLHTNLYDVCSELRELIEDDNSDPDFVTEYNALMEVIKKYVNAYALKMLKTEPILTQSVALRAYDYYYYIIYKYQTILPYVFSGSYLDSYETADALYEYTSNSVSYSERLNKDKDLSNKIGHFVNSHFELNENNLLPLIVSRTFDVNSKSFFQAKLLKFVYPIIGEFINNLEFVKELCNLGAAQSFEPIEIKSIRYKNGIREYRFGKQGLVIAPDLSKHHNYTVVFDMGYSKLNAKAGHSFIKAMKLFYKQEFGDTISYRPFSVSFKKPKNMPTQSASCQCQLVFTTNILKNVFEVNPWLKEHFEMILNDIF